MRAVAKTLLNKPERALLLAALIPIIFVILLVAKYGYTVPWLDEYGHVTQLIRSHMNGELTLATAWDAGRRSPPVFPVFAFHHICRHQPRKYSAGTGISASS